MVVLSQHYQNSDRTSLIGGADNALTDGTHPNLSGAMRNALDAARDLLPFFPNNGPLDTLSGVGVDAATAIDVNPINVGTGGVLFNGSNTGVVADDMQAAALNGTAVWSKVARLDGPGEWQQVVWSPASANQLCLYNLPFAVRQRPLNAGVQVGDFVSAMLEIEYDAATVPGDVFYPTIQMEFVGAGVTVTGNVFNSVHTAMDSSGWRGVIKTPKFQIPVGTTALDIQHKITNKTTGVETVRFGRHGLINYSQ